MLDDPSSHEPQTLPAHPTCTLSMWSIIPVHVIDNSCASNVSAAFDKDREKSLPAARDAWCYSTWNCNDYVVLISTLLSNQMTAVRLEKRRFYECPLFTYICQTH